MQAGIQCHIVDQWKRVAGLQGGGQYGHGECCWEAREVQVSFMGRVHDGARWCVDGDGGCCGMLVANGGGAGEKMSSATRIGNGIKWCGRRTSGIGTML